MCEVQELGAPGSGSHRGASPPPERLSVSSSGAEEDLKTPRNSLLSHSDEGLKGEPPEGTSSSRKESGDIEASELSPATSRKMKVDEEKKDDEEEVEREKVERETMGEDENVKEESESEAKDVKDCVCDESERENQENERRDELVENALNMEKDIKGDKTVDNSAEEEENRRGNDEAASKSDSPKAEEPGKQEEEEGKQNNDQEEKDNKDKHEDDEKKNTEREEKTEEEEEKGVDPFRPKETTDAPITRKASKTVNFLDDELKKHIENNLSKRNTTNSTSSSSSFKSKKEEEEEEEEEEDERDVKEDRIGGGELEKNGRHWALGEGNPVYRLSLKLSPNLFNTTDIPGANQHKEAEKTGFLTKLSGRSFPYIAQWKRRYCVLSKGRLYYYEREDSKAGDKSNGVIQLEYFDQVAEAGPKECKKATNVFVITSQDRSFFDPGRHLFSADTLPDMKDWIRRLQAALDQIRNNNRPAASTSPSASPSTQDGGGKRRRDEAAESKDSKGSQTHIGSNKERKKKKEESGRARKSSRVGISNETQTSMVEPMTCEVDGVRPAMAAPKGGVILPGFSSRKDLQATSRSVQRREDENEAEDGLPRAGPTLPSVTKQRVKGPPGRRAPQNHRRAAAAALKKRASSLSALEHQDVNDNRSESSEGATRSYRDSQTPEVDKEETESEEENERKKLKKETLYEEEQEVQDISPERQFKIDNIDDGLFFKPGLKDVGAGLGDGSDRDSQRKRRTLGLKVNFEEDSSSSSKNGTLGRLLKFRDTVTLTKRKKYETKEALAADHPDMMINSRWRCVIL